MPLYEYKCDSCGQRFEVIQKFADAPAETCASCGKGPVRRLLSSPAIQFKGSGWYITDYAQKGKSDSSGGEKTSGEPAAKSEKSDSKTEKSTATAAASSASTPAKS